MKMTDGTNVRQGFEKEKLRFLGGGGWLDLGGGE